MRLPWGVGVVRLLTLKKRRKRKREKSLTLLVQQVIENKTLLLEYILFEPSTYLNTLKIRLMKKSKSDYQININGAIYCICILVLSALISFCTKGGQKSIVNKPLVPACLDSIFEDNLAAADLHPECVKVLRLWGRHLSEFPKNIANYSNLEALDIADNNTIDSIPDSIGQLTKLEGLAFTNSRLKYLPATIGNLKRLKDLALIDNNFETLPESIGDLSSLERLNLCGNNIKTLPKSIIRLKNLKFLCLAPWEGKCLISPAEQEFLKANLPDCDISFGD
jgi:Leucine rich repeat